MSALRYYGKLAAVLDGRLLEQECAIHIVDRVNAPCRVTIESAVPAEGLEVDARTRLGESVTLVVCLLHPATRDVTEVLSIAGRIVASEMKQGLEGTPVASFTVEAETKPAEQEPA